MRAEGDLRVKLTRSFLDLSEFRRSLLGFPSPGRRRDESSERMTSVPGVVQDAIEPSGPAESASADASAGPTAGPTEQALPLS